MPTGPGPAAGAAGPAATDHEFGGVEVDGERMQVLKMLEAGQITAEEAAKLLAALEPGEGAHKEAPESRGKARWLRVRVTDLKTGRPKVNVSLPLGLVELGTRLGARFAKVPGFEEVNVAEMMDVIKSGAHGQIVDVEDEDEGQRVEIYLD